MQALDLTIPSPSLVQAVVEDRLPHKGGTAINLLIRNMPRLSVDIDLTYVPVAPRAESLAAIDAAMKRIVERVNKTIAG